MVPPLDEVAALGIGFVIPVNADVVTPYSALGVVQRGSMNPAIVDFNLLEKLDVERGGFKYYKGFCRFGDRAGSVLTN